MPDLRLGEGKGREEKEKERKMKIRTIAMNKEYSKILITDNF